MPCKPLTDNYGRTVGFACRGPRPTACRLIEAVFEGYFQRELEERVRAKGRATITEAFTGSTLGKRRY